ncbi:MAG: tripartite tricarboxylate transporter substrate binding protein [Betaproteobacteria bacterium]|nr:tripartite tricarboxylate transporter substrate binding protein [Betaproteobacteria bacterium]
MLAPKERTKKPELAVVQASNVLVINTSLPATNVAELVKLAKSSPGKFNYASAGIASPAHLAGEMLNLLADIKMTHIPYKGAGPALLDVIAGTAQLIITSPIAAGAHMTSGRVRALATTGAQRNPGLPDLPTLAETIPGYDISQSWGITVPAGTPPAIVKTLSAEFVKALNLPDTRERILRTGAVPGGGTPEEFDAFIAAERTRLGEVIAKTGIVLAD